MDTFYNLPYTPECKYYPITYVSYVDKQCQNLTERDILHLKIESLKCEIANYEKQLKELSDNDEKENTNSEGVDDIANNELFIMGYKQSLKDRRDCMVPLYNIDDDNI